MKKQRKKINIPDKEYFFFSGAAILIFQCIVFFAIRNVDIIFFFLFLWLIVPIIYFGSKIGSNIVDGKGKTVVRDSLITFALIIIATALLCKMLF